MNIVDVDFRYVLRIADRKDMSDMSVYTKKIKVLQWRKRIGSDYGVVVTLAPEQWTEWQDVRTEEDNMRPTVKEALKRVFEELEALSPDELAARLREHQDGDLARAMVETSAFLVWRELQGKDVRTEKE